MIQATSLAAYDDVKRNLGARQAEVLQALEAAPDGLAAFEIAERLHEPKPWVMPRITELQEKGVVVKTMLRRLDPNTGKRGIVWRRAESQGQRELW